MCSYCKKHNETEVPDPYYGGPQGFEKVSFIFVILLLYGEQNSYHLQSGIDVLKNCNVVLLDTKVTSMYTFRTLKCNGVYITKVHLNIIKDEGLFKSVIFNESVL